jgi:hypothetical protein
VISSRSSTSASNISNFDVNHSENSNFKILQINISGIRNKINELNLLLSEIAPDVITIQESKLTSECKTPFLNG